MAEFNSLDRPVIDWTISTYQRINPPPPQNINKNVMFIQRQHHEKKLREMKPPEAIEKLYQLEATRRQVMELLQEEEGVKKNNPECSWKPEIDKKSEELAGRLDPKVVNRVYHWQENKNQKIKELSQRQREQREQELAESTQKLKYVNSNFEVDSKVKNFVDSLDHKKQLNASRMIYQSHAPFGAGAREDGAFQSPVQFQSEPVQREVLSRGGPGVKVYGALPPDAVQESTGPFIKKKRPVRVGGDAPELPPPRQLGKEFVRGLVRDI